MEYDRDIAIQDAFERLEIIRKIEDVLSDGGECDKMLYAIAKILGFKKA